MSAIGPLLAALDEQRIEWLITVPGSGLGELYCHYERRRRCIYATREEEGVAIASGLTLGARRAAVAMQQSGVGNALNAVFTLADAYQIHFPLLVFDRSQNDVNPVQRVSSRCTQRVLSGLGSVTLSWSDPGSARAFGEALAARTRWIVCNL